MIGGRAPRSLPPYIACPSNKQATTTTTRTDNHHHRRAGGTRSPSHPTCGGGEGRGSAARRRRRRRSRPQSPPPRTTTTTTSTTEGEDDTLDTPRAREDLRGHRSPHSHDVVSRRALPASAHHAPEVPPAPPPPLAEPRAFRGRASARQGRPEVPRRIYIRAAEGPAAPPPPRESSDVDRAGRAFEHLLDTVTQDYENNHGGGKGWDGRGGG